MGFGAACIYFLMLVSCSYAGALFRSWSCSLAYNVSINHFGMNLILGCNLMYFGGRSQ